MLPDRELEDLFVDPEFMRRGIGRALVRDAGAPLTVIANEHARAFYESLGFVVTGIAQTTGRPSASHGVATLSRVERRGIEPDRPLADTAVFPLDSPPP